MVLVAVEINYLAEGTSPTTSRSTTGYRHDRQPDLGHPVGDVPEGRCIATCDVTIVMATRTATACRDPARRCATLLDAVADSVGENWPRACPCWRRPLPSCWACRSPRSARRSRASSIARGSASCAMLHSRLSRGSRAGCAPAIARASSIAAAWGSSAIRVTKPWRQRLVRAELARGIGQLAQHVVAHQRRARAGSRPCRAPAPNTTRGSRSARPGATMRMSAPDMIWNPPPNATPWTAAITGIGRLRQPQATCCGRIAPWALRSAEVPLPPARHARHVEPGAERPALARQHDAAHVGPVGQRVDRGADPFEHRRVDRVHLVGADQADVGDLVADGNGDAVVEGLGHGTQAKTPADAPQLRAARPSDSPAPVRSAASAPPRGRAGPGRARYGPRSRWCRDRSRGPRPRCAGPRG